MKFRPTHRNKIYYLFKFLVNLNNQNKKYTSTYKLAHIKFSRA